MRTILLSLIIAPSICLAQCEMQVEITSYVAMCGSYMVDYSITDGTGPYTITASNINGQLIQETAAVPQGSWVFQGTSWNVTIFVIDGAGCTAQTDESSPVFHSHQTSSFEWSTECVSGTTTLRMTNSSSICDPTNLFYLLQVEVDGVYQQYASGTFADDWTELSTGLYELDQDLPPGRYQVVVPETELQCPESSFSWIECWNIWPALDYSSEFLGINVGDCGANAYVRAALGGAFENGSMRDDLRTNGLVPLIEPYTGLGYSFIGPGAGASVQPTRLAVSGDLAIVDWVVLEIRQISAPYTVVRSKPALLLRNGSIHDSDGDPYVNFGVLPVGSYRMAIRHRNHLGVMTLGPVLLEQSPGPPVIDFRFAGTVFGGALATTFSGFTRLLWPGDATGDGQVKYTGTGNDRDPILQGIGGSLPTAVVNNVYSPLDINLDGSIRYTGAGNDRDIILQTIGGSVPTAVRQQQLP